MTANKKGNHLFYGNAALIILIILCFLTFSYGTARCLENYTKSDSHVNTGRSEVPETGKLMESLQNTSQNGTAVGLTTESQNKNDVKTTNISSPGTVLIKFRKGVTRTEALNAINRASQTTAVKEFKHIGRFKQQDYYKLRSDLSAEETMEILKKYPDVESVSPDYLRQIAGTVPNDPYFNQQWGLHNTGQEINGVSGIPGADISAVPAWDYRTDASSSVIAVLDTGVLYSHPDLAQNMWTNPNDVPGNNIDDDANGYIDDVYGIDLTNNDSNPIDDHFHGTHVAGIIGAIGNNGTGVGGVCWNSRIMAVKCIGWWGSGYDSDFIEAIDYVVNMKVNHDVNIVAINASWGGRPYSEFLKDAIDAAGNAGIIFVAAAGNFRRDNDVNPYYPASYDLPNIVAVGATDQNDGLADFSNFGAGSVDIGAPGVNILSTVFDHTPEYGDIFYDDMESGPANWTSGGINNSWQITDQLPVYNCAPPNDLLTPYHAWTDSPDGNYSSNTDSYIALNHDIDLSSYTNQSIHVFFTYTYDVGGSGDPNSDLWYLQFSHDAGQTWTYTYYFSGHNLGCWSKMSMPIPEAYKTPFFRLRLRLMTDESTNYAGVYIDDVGIVLAKPGYALASGTSMAAPHVSGAAALISSAFPYCTMSDRIGFILDGADVVDELTGKVKYSGRLNIHNAFIDSDADGLPDGLENIMCTDPDHADTDNDGIIDGNEDINKNGIQDQGETDPCNIDSDGDNIQDGTELGYTTGHADTDPSVFRADLDDSTMTDPLVPDSDGDEFMDGTEDWNANGRIDTGETDPLDDTSVPVPGDLNADGSLDLTDAILALRISAWINPGQPVYPSREVSGDSKIGIEEVIHIMEKVTGIRE